MSIPGGAVAILSWTRPDGVTEAIPVAALYTTLCHPKRSSKRNGYFRRQIGDNELATT